MAIRNILVATDFSADSEAALERAIEFAKAFKATLHLVHSYFITVQATPSGFIVLPDDVIASARTQAEERLEVLAKRLSELGVSVETHASAKDPVSSILELAGSLPAYMIVIGTRGLTGLKHVLLGSVAERTVRLASCPVLTVKARAASCS